MGYIRRKRMEIFRVLEVPKLDVEFFQPPRQAGDFGTLPQPGGSATASDRWSLEMMCGLMQRLADRAGAEGGVLSESALLQVLVERRNTALRYQGEVVPASWVDRSE